MKKKKDINRHYKKRVFKPRFLVIHLGTNIAYKIQLSLQYMIKFLNSLAFLGVTLNCQQS